MAGLSDKEVMKKLKDESIDFDKDDFYQQAHDELGLNTCDKCGKWFASSPDDFGDLIWINTEGFHPLKGDNYNAKKCNIARKTEKYDALCESCYHKLCCGK